MNDFILVGENRKKMRKQFSPSSDEDDNHSDILSSSRSSFHNWWRSAKEFDENGNLKLDYSNLITDLTPRLKVIREMERLALIATDGLDDLRHKLLSYKSGDFWLPTGGIKKEEMEISPIITILLVGFSGAGKSSIINLMYSVLGRSGLIPFTQTSGVSSEYTTMFMEEHNVLRSMRSGFCVYDSRGLDYSQLDESLQGLNNWMVTGIHHHQLCRRPGVEENLTGPIMPSTSRFIRRRVNCAMVVVNIAETYKALLNGDSKPLESTKELFYSHSMRKSNENPILIMTHGDKLTVEERIDGRIKICEFLGISETSGTYDIVCLTEHGILAEESDPITAYALTEAIYRALIFSDRTHSPKTNYKDYFFNILNLIICFIAGIFTYLAHFFSQLADPNKLKRM
ncbi:hypothetical protein MKW98_025373 [Papaver atlanticum]|uniref:Uncharacterized protein n=1 Tax=Papaver atlanticum TaxID=357466 RepID=A0AAD4SBR8_9MAGN|nr:hypothetical protein MKW98_025373 [Papaver atlanticum]